jgi:tagatose 6-phosphate kinase
LELLETLRFRGIEADFVSVAATTRQCLTILDETAHTVTELVEESRPVSTADYESLKAIIKKHLPKCEAVILSGSLTPGGPSDFYQMVVEQARTAGILSIVDAQGPPLIEALKAKPGLVKPNRLELAATVQHPLQTEQEVIEAMREILKAGASQIVVTAGKQPILAMDGEGIWRVHSPKVSVVNPIGSGDSFTAGLVWRLTQGSSLGEACRWAAAAGAANALGMMPGELQKQDVERLASEVKTEKI